MKKKAKDLLLVDNHPIIVVAVKALIESKKPDWEFRSTNRRKEAIEMARKKRPDLAIIDLALPDGDGLSLIRELRAAAPECRVLVFSAQDELKFGPRVMRSGAHGYLMKGANIHCLMQAVETIENGDTYCSPELTRALMNTFGENGGRGKGVDTLSDREFQVFRLIGQGKTAKEIGAVFNISPKTVDSHRENMKHKLKCSTTTELAFLARDWFQFQPDMERA